MSAVKGGRWNEAVSLKEKTHPDVEMRIGILFCYCYGRDDGTLKRWGV